MKKGIHPNYHNIKVVMTDGTSYEVGSTYGKEGDVLKLEIDPKTHPAWTGKMQLVDTAGQISRFKTRYSNIKFT